MNMIGHQAASGANPASGYGMLRVPLHLDDPAVFYFQKKAASGMA
jgi:hypothetical protein